MDKLEKHIKEKLEEQHIAPSPDAWDKIASQLSTPPHKRKRNWYPFAIAASFLGVVLVSYLFFNSDSSQRIESQVVEQNTNMQKEVEIPKQNELLDGQPEIEPTELAEKVVEPKPENNKEVKELQRQIKETELAQEIQHRPIKETLVSGSDKLIALKVEEVVAQVQSMENKQDQVTDAEIDSLLRAAQKQILTDKIFTNTGSVDAMTLLAEVEDEMDETFRNQIFDALKDGYLKLRTAVADRNN